MTVLHFTIGQFEIDRQLGLVPERIDLLVFYPISSLWRELHIKLEQDPCEDQSHFGIRQTGGRKHRQQMSLWLVKINSIDSLPADTVAWTNTERLQNAEIILGKFRIAEKPFRSEFFRLSEVPGAMVGGQLPDGYGSLFNVQSAPR